MNISLVGYMGSGKSVTGNDLSKVLGYEFIDLDDYIEQKYNKKIEKIFNEEGELGFRKKEKEVLPEVLIRDNIVLSLGGGTPAYYNNMEIINASSISIYLKADLATIVTRLIDDKSKRPLINHLKDEELHEFVAKHLFERSYYYQKARHILDVKNYSRSEVLDEIVKKMKFELI